MRFESTSYNDLFNEAAETLATRTGISNFNADSKAFSIISTFLNEDKSLVDQANSIISSLKLGEATGSDLEVIGEFVGLSRTKATRATVKAVDTNLQFYVDSGTFGTINGGSAISIPANTVIYLDDKDSTSGRRVEYRTTTTISLPIGGTSVFFAADAVEFGTESNVSALALNKHLFTSYVDSSNNTLKVRNNYAIVNGTDVQSNDSYRFAINRQWAAAAAANEISLRIAALSMPGVKEVKILRWYNGIGTTGIIVDTFEGRVTDSLLTSVRNRVSQVVAAGELANTYTPKYVAIEIDMVVQTRTNLTSAEKTKLSNLIINFTKNYINSFKLGQGFTTDLYLNNIIRNNNQIVRIGRKAGLNVLEELNVYYIDSLGQYSKRQIINTDIAINQDQKIILLDTVSNPVRVTIEKI